MAGRRQMSVSDRFWEKVDKSGECWVWTAAAGKYGKFGIVRRMVEAHRVAWELLIGPIPADMQIDHRCHNPLCVRPHPEHCRLATVKQNGENRRGARSGTLSGVRGVTRGNNASKPWVAQVGHNGQVLRLGYFATIEEAAAVAQAKRTELFTHNNLDRSPDFTWYP